MTTATQTPALPAGAEISPGDERYFRVTSALYTEADLLDTYRLAEWFELCSSDIVYRMPTRTTRFLRDGEGFEDMAFFEENSDSLNTRVRRLETDFAWAEAPPSRTRHFVTNIRAFETGSASETAVRSNFLVTRTRSDQDYQMFTGVRDDIWRDTGGTLRLARRTIYVDQTVLTATNLSVLF